MSDKIVHLHTHSDFSTLDGMVRVSDLVRRVKSLGQPALALTDHGNISGIPDLIRSCNAEGIKPIAGCEFYFNPGTSEEVNKKPMHLVVYARNLEGYYQLIKLNNAAWRTNSSINRMGTVRGVLNIEHLREFGGKNLIAQTACLSGPMCKIIEGKTEAGEFFSKSNPNGSTIINDESAAVREILAINEKLKKYFDYFFIELQHHDIPEERAAYGLLERVVRDYDLPFVITTDIHYLEPNHKDDHSVYMAMQFKKTVSQIDEKRNKGWGYHVTTREEVENYSFSRDTLKKGIDQTLEINSLIEGINLKDIQADVPHFKFNLTLDDLILPKLEELDEEYRKRAIYELGSIKKMGFENYFLAVWDYVNYAKMHNILVGPGRGSAAGSLVNFLLGITTVDPMKYNLSWERFLNEGRVRVQFEEGQFF